MATQLLTVSPTCAVEFYPIVVTFGSGDDKHTQLWDVSGPAQIRLNWTAAFDCQISLYESCGNLIDRVQVPANAPGEYDLKFPRRGSYVASLFPIGLSPGESGTGLMRIETDDP